LYWKISIACWASLNLMFMVPYILVIYVQLKLQLDVLIMYSLFLSIFSSTCFGCYCTHPQELQL
jgi:hypothetical protein